MSFKKLSPSTQSITISRFAVERHGQGKASSVGQKCGPVLRVSIVYQECVPAVWANSVGQQ